MLMARYWVAKHQSFLQLWMHAGSPFPYTYTEEDLAGFVEPPEFTTMGRSMIGYKARAIARFEELRAVRLSGRGCSA